MTKAQMEKEIADLNGRIYELTHERDGLSVRVAKLVGQSWETKQSKEQSYCGCCGNACGKEGMEYQAEAPHICDICGKEDSVKCRVMRRCENCFAATDGSNSGTKPGERAKECKE